MFFWGHLFSQKQTPGGHAGGLAKGGGITKIGFYMSKIPKCRLETYWANKEIFRLDTAIIFRLDTAIIFRLQVVRKSTPQFSPSSRSQVRTAVFRKNMQNLHVHQKSHIACFGKKVKN